MKYYDIKDVDHSIITYKDTKVDKDGFRKVYDFDYTQFQKDQGAIRVERVPTALKYIIDFKTFKDNIRKIRKCRNQSSCFS